MSILGKVWRKWIRIAEAIGNFQLIIFLAVIYWTLLLMIAVPFKILADPLGFRKKNIGVWIKRRRETHILDGMKRQG